MARDYKRGERIDLGVEEDSCFVCGWDSGPAVVVEGMWMETEKVHAIVPICWVCANTSSGSTASWGMTRIGRQASSIEMYRALSEHTNIILEAIASGNPRPQ